jgi:hypothetical protein
MERLRYVFNRLTWMISDMGAGTTNATALLELEADWSDASGKLRALREAIQGSIVVGAIPLIDQTGRVIEGDA